MRSHGQLGEGVAAHDVFQNLGSVVGLCAQEVGELELGQQHRALELVEGEANVRHDSLPDLRDLGRNGVP